MQSEHLTAVFKVDRQLGGVRLSETLFSYLLPVKSSTSIHHRSGFQSGRQACRIYTVRLALHFRIAAAWLLHLSRVSGLAYVGYFKPWSVPISICQELPCSGDHTVKVICVRTGKCLQTLTGHRRTPWVVSLFMFHLRWIVCRDTVQQHIFKPGVHCRCGSILAAPPYWQAALWTMKYACGTHTQQSA